MSKEQVFSICGMCTVRCPIMTEVEKGEVSFIQGNPYASGIEGSICARGAAGLVLLKDKERPQAPLIRKGQRGEGKWRAVSWNNALDYAEQPSLKPYKSPDRPPEGRYRLTFGRCAVHTQGHTVNNPMLFEQMPENMLWIHSQEAEKLGISNGDVVEVSNGRYSGRMKAKITDMIHPKAVFIVHGFGHTLPVETKAYGKGVADHKLMPHGLDIWDSAGGAVALQEHFVAVTKAG